MFEKQCRDNTSKDWVRTVESDLEKVGLNVTFADIKEMSKVKWKNTVKKSVNENALLYLETVKQTHSKVKLLKHPKLQIQAYFLPNKLNMCKEEIQYIFKMRCKVVNVKMNLQGIYDTYECKVCLHENESQEHVYQCKEIWNLRKIWLFKRNIS